MAGLAGPDRVLLTNVRTRGRVRGIVAVLFFAVLYCVVRPAFAAGTDDRLRIDRAAVQLGVLSADLAEMLEDDASLTSPATQATIDATFDALERTAPNSDVSGAFVSLRSKLVATAGNADKRAAYSAFTSATHGYVAALPVPLGRCFVIGAGLRQVYHNAIGPRITETDSRERAMLGQLDDADELYPDFHASRQTLVRLPAGDFIHVAKLASRLLDGIIHG